MNSVSFKTMIGKNSICYFLVLCSFILIFNGCVEEDSPVPLIVSPINGTTYYPDQEILIKWIVPDSSRMTEMQILSSNDPHFFDKGVKLFEELRPSIYYYNQSSYGEVWGSSLSDKIYFGFRLRYLGPHGISKWTPITYYSVFPYSTLSVGYLTIESDFQFVAKETNDIYSDLIESATITDLSKEINLMGFDINRLEFIKLHSGTVKDIWEYGMYGSHLTNVVFGFNSGTSHPYPFDVWGHVYNTQSEAGITFSPFGGVYRDIYKEIGNKNIRMKAAYTLSNILPKEEQIGKEHFLKVKIKLACYFRN